MNTLHPYHPVALVRTFADEHDTRIVFHAVFLLLTVLAALMLNIGFFGLLIAAHMMLDIIKYRDIHGFSWSTTLSATIHESLIDLTLFAVALVFSVYFHHSVGLIGVSGLLRAELTLIRFVGTAIPKFFILEDFLKVIAHLHHYMERIRPDLYREWRRVDRIYLLSIALSVFLLFFAPQIMNADASVIQQIVLWELIPWNI